MPTELDVLPYFVPSVVTGNNRVFELGKDVLEEELGAFLDKADTRIFASDEKMDDAIKRIVRQVTMEEIGKKPLRKIKTKKEIESGNEAMGEFIVDVDVPYLKKLEKSKKLITTQ